MASPSPSIERRVAGDEDTTGGKADHGVGSIEGKGFAGMESDEYDLQEDETEHDHPVEGEGFTGMESDEYDFQEDETEHDHHAEADVDNGNAVELEDNLAGVGGMSDNYSDDDLYAVDSGESIGWIDFLNLSEEEVLCFNFADVDIVSEFYQQYAKHHGFSARHSRSEKRGEVRIQQEFVCHRQGYRSPKFYSMPNRKKRPRAETRCGCPARIRQHELEEGRRLQEKLHIELEQHQTTIRQLDDKANELKAKIADLRQREQQQMAPGREMEGRLEVVEIKLGILARQLYAQDPVTAHGSNDQEPTGHNGDDVGGI